MTYTSSEHTAVADFDPSPSATNETHPTQTSHEDTAVCDGDLVERAHEIVEMAKGKDGEDGDAGAPFEPDNLTILAELKKENRAEFERILPRLKGAGVRTKELQKSLKAAPISRKVPSETTEGETWCDGDLLARFSAWIVRDKTYFDAADHGRRYYEIAGRLDSGEPLPTVEVSAGDFSKLQRWVSGHWGSRAIIMPGAKTDRLRAAIQEHSNPEKVTVYEHSGWRKVNGEYVYLHADGTIGATGIQTQLPKPAVRLTEPSDANQLQEAVQASIRLLEAAPRTVSWPLLVAPYRAAIDTFYTNRQSLFLAGRTQAGKSCLAALAQQHFGSSFDADSLPGSWLSTFSALGQLCHQMKDAVVVVDDFKPAHLANNSKEADEKADMLLRAQANGTGRQRYNTGKCGISSHDPTSLVISTGEEIPPGESLRARLMILKLKQGDVDWRVVGRLQADARAGRFTEAMAGYIDWIRTRAPGLEGRLDERFEVWRKYFRTRFPSNLKRVVDNAADLVVGAELFLKFAVSVGAIPEDRRYTLLKEAAHAIEEVGRLQLTYQEHSDPCTHFLAMLKSALRSGEAYVVALEDEGAVKDGPFKWANPEEPPDGGWIGWTDGYGLFLTQKPTYSAIRAYAQKQGDPIKLTEKQLWKRLKHSQWLGRCDPDKTSTKLAGCKTRNDRPRVVHIPTLDKQ